MQVSAYSQKFSGPLPPPEILREYDAIVPGAAKDIIESFIKEGEHRRALQTRETTMCEQWARADVGLQKVGQILGFVIAISGVVGGLYVAATGAPAAGTVVSSASLAAIVIAFLRQRNTKNINFDDDKADTKPNAKKE
jgi:uncharacterized membrane protein